MYEFRRQFYRSMTESVEQSKPNATCERVSDALTSLAAALTRWSDAFTLLFSNAALLIMAAAVASAAVARL